MEGFYSKMGVAGELLAKEKKGLFWIRTSSVGGSEQQRFCPCRLLVLIGKFQINRGCILEIGWKLQLSLSLLSGGKWLHLRRFISFFFFNGCIIPWESWCVEISFHVSRWLSDDVSRTVEGCRAYGDRKGSCGKEGTGEITENRKEIRAMWLLELSYFKVINS